MLRKFIIVLSLIGCMVMPVALFADNTTLSHIVNKIASIKNLLNKDTNKRERLQNDLERAETHSGNISKRLHLTQKSLKRQTALLENLKANKAKNEKKLNVQKKLLNQQIQTAYMLGREPYLKLLLNQENSAEISRILMYYHFINQSRVRAITDIKTTLQQIQMNQEEIQAQYQTLRKLQTQQKSQKSQLLKAQKKRKQLLSALNKNIQTRQGRLAILMANKRRLEKTIKQIGHPTEQFPKANFSKLQKRLHWPTRGRILQIYGTKIEQSELRWGGVLIKAPEGQPVYAIAKGKVVFAKWLSGYGLLLIVNHGNGYMTLYGRNHVLYKNVGDIVQRGDLISTVGQTGGYPSPALYFAVRHNGKPINPTVFISKEAK